MNSLSKDEIKNLPSEPGIYFFLDNNRKIIYIGKAANLKRRVNQYFYSSLKDLKTKQLVKNISSLSFIVLDSEIDALFLESEMIKRYKPKYNILLRDNKSLCYIRINLYSAYPSVSIVRQVLDDKANYFGPYLSVLPIRKALRSLRQIIPFYDSSKNRNRKRVSLDYHLGLEPGLEEGKTTEEEYRKNLRYLIKIIRGNKKAVIDLFTKKMDQATKNQNYEEAIIYRNKLFSLKALDQKIIFSDKEYIDISKDYALDELRQLFNFKKIPKRIEGIDVSHMSGTNVVASMVVFINGVSTPKEYRRFKIKIDQNNDFYNIYQTLKRRLTKTHLIDFGWPDLIIIDGGKGQLESAIKARDSFNLTIPMIGIAKKREQIVVSKYGSNLSLNLKYLSFLNGYMTETEKFIVIDLDLNTNLIKLIQRIRDESHRFAITYHSLLKNKI